MRDLVIVGGGVMGLAAAWRGAEGGLEVTLIEASAVGNDQGSSHGPTRIFRTSYDHPAYVAMAKQAEPMWRALETHPEHLLKQRGGIDLGHDRALDALRDALTRGGAAFEPLPAAEIEQRWPWLRCEGDGIYSPDTGVLNARAALRTMADRARAAGAEILEGEPGEIVDAQDNGVRVRVGSRIVEARAGVVTAGAWVNRVLRPLGIELPIRVSEEHVFYVDAAVEPMPVVWRGDRFFYTVPGFEPGDRLKVGDHQSGLDVDPDAAREPVDPGAHAELSSWVAETFPSAGPIGEDGDSCLYATTPDEHFVIDRVGSIVIASPCSGHGFKFAPLIGEAVVALATGAEPPFDLSLFRRR